MYVHVGNDHAIEGYRDETSDDPDLVRYRPAEGERITEVVFPEGLNLSEAFSTTLAVLEHHLAQGEKPAWVESDSEGLTSLLAEHWELDESQTSRPEGWGTDTGADEFATETPHGEES